MLDIKYIKENPEEVIERLKIKGKDAKAEIEQILALDNERRNLIHRNSNSYKRSISKKIICVGMGYFIC